MANVQMIKGTEAKINNKAKANGQLLFATDTGDVYLDTSTSNRLKLGGGFLTSISLSGKTLTGTKANGNETIDLPFVKTTGDTMTGALHISTTAAAKITLDRPVIDFSKSDNGHPDSSSIDSSLAFRDKNGIAYGYVFARSHNTGNSQIVLQTRNYPNGTSADYSSHSLYLGSSRDGTPTVVFAANDGANNVVAQARAAWRGALAYSGTAPITVNNSAGTVSMTAASSSAAGYVTTGDQTIAGAKTFNANLSTNGSVYVNTLNQAVKLGVTGTTTTVANSLYFRVPAATDTNNTTLNWSGAVRLRNTTLGKNLNLVVREYETDSGEIKENALSLYMDKNKNPTVSVSSKVAWREAFQLAYTDGNIMGVAVENTNSIWYYLPIPWMSTDHSVSNITITYSNAKIKAYVDGQRVENKTFAKKPTFTWYNSRGILELTEARGSNYLFGSSATYSLLKPILVFITGMTINFS